MNFENHSLSPGVELRLLKVEDADELFAIVERNRDRLRRWLPWLDAIQSVEDELAFLRRSQEQTAKDIAFDCGIILDGKIVGVVGVHPINYANRKVEIGYWLDAVHEGKGLITTACQVVVRRLFREFHLNRVVIYCATENIRSRAISERLGFKLEGIHRDAEWLYDRFVDLACYSMLEREWKEGSLAKA